MSLFKGKYRVKTWQELSASVASESDLSFKPVKKLPKKMQQGKHNYKTQKGWFKRHKIKESAALKSDGTVDGSSLSQGFFIYDSGSNVAYSGYPKQPFKDDMMEMLASQSFTTNARNQMSASFTGVNWPEIVVIQEEYVTQSATVNVGWDRVAVMLSSSDWTNHSPSASVNFLNSSTDDIGMMQSYNVSTNQAGNGNARSNYDPAGTDRLFPIWEFTLPVTTASFMVKSDSTTNEFSASFHLTSLTSPGYTASDGTVNVAYTQQELLDSLEWKYNGTASFGTTTGSGAGPLIGSSSKGIGDAHQVVVVKDHSGNSLSVLVTEQEVKSQVFGDDPNESPTQHPSTIAIFSSFGGTYANITSSVCKRYAYNDVNATGSFDNVTIYYCTRGIEILGLGHTSGLGSHIFADSGLVAAATPGVYKDFIPTVTSGAFITTQTSSMSQLIRFSGSAT